MDFFLIFTGAFVVAFSGALIPGPMLSVTLFHSLRRGFKAGPLVIVGHAAAEIILLIFIAAGLGAWLVKPAVNRWIFLIGGSLLLITGVYLIYIRKTSPQIKDEIKTSDAGPVLSGFLTSVSNPTWTVWWATIGIVYVTKSLEYGIIGLAFFFSGHILADLAWYAFVSFSVSKGRKFITPPLYAKILTACGVLLFIFGVWFIISGF